MERAESRNLTNTLDIIHNSNAKLAPIKKEKNAREPSPYLANTEYEELRTNDNKPYMPKHYNNLSRSSYKEHQKMIVSSHKRQTQMGFKTQTNIFAGSPIISHEKSSNIMN
jgi:hypothetical protein